MLFCFYEGNGGREVLKKGKFRRQLPRRRLSAAGGLLRSSGRSLEHALRAAHAQTNLSARPLASTTRIQPPHIARSLNYYLSYCFLPPELGFTPSIKSAARKQAGEEVCRNLRICASMRRLCPLCTDRRLTIGFGKSLHSPPRLETGSLASARPRGREHTRGRRRRARARHVRAPRCCAAGANHHRRRRRHLPCSLAPPLLPV